ncbi:hypothetical protein [Solidesulfovibrio sp.]
MRNLFAWASICVTAGVFGALANSVFLWMAGANGWTAALGVALAPEWTRPWLYQRLIWGGIWGLAFMPRLMPNSFFWRGVLVSLGPTVVQLFIVFPSQLEKGYFGLELGNLTPVVVLLVNAVWGWGAALWLLMADEERHMYSRRLR